MSDSSVIMEKPRGFALLIANVMNPLNENPNFKKMFKNTKRKYLINASNLDYAALISIDRGELTIQGVPNKPNTNLKKKVSGWDGLVSMDSQTFLALSMKRISKIKVGLKWIFGNVKMKGLLKLLLMLKLFDLLQQ